MSLYPSKGLKHFKLSGVAAYTKNLVNSLISITDRNIVVFANRINRKREEYIENQVEVIRCWDKGILYAFQVFWKVFVNKSKIDLIHIQHEYFLYDGAFSAIVFPFLVLLLKSLGKSIIVTLHGVIPISMFDREFMKENNLKGNLFILELGILMITKLISWFANEIIVHENYFREVLSEEYGVNRTKITVIPHGIEERKDLIDQSRAKRILGVNEKRILLFFGYITGYKGIETLIDAFNYLKGRDYVLFIAGGEHPRLKEEPMYQRYLENLKKKAGQISGNIIFVGFVPEEKLTLYFSAADLAVFPYTICMSSSGPLTFALSYSRPFLVSELFREIVELRDVIFEGSPKALAEKIEAFFSQADLREKALEYGKQLKEERLWGNVGRKTLGLYQQTLRNLKI